MPNTVKAIETKYAGCRFRSRLEARYAVFLDALGMGWEYEPQGFATKAGPYLPDFRVAAGIGPMWLEVKGSAAPGIRELAVAAEVQQGTGFPLRFLCGDVPRGCATGADVPADAGCVDAYIPSGQPVLLRFGTRTEVDRALAAARGARFEHGEHGR